MSKRRNKNTIIIKPTQLEIEEAYGVIGGKLRRTHVGDLVKDLAMLCEARTEREKELALEGIKLTIREASEKFESGLFLPAIQRARELIRESEQKRNELAQRQSRTQTIAEFLAAGGEIKKLPSEKEAKAQAKTAMAGLSLSDLGL